MNEEWYVYVLFSESQSLTYIGITKNITRRLDEHNGHRPGGAKFTRRGRPWKAVSYHGPFPDRSEASKMERRLKKLRGRKRINPLLD